MATTAWTIEQATRDGLDATYQAAAGGDGNVFNNKGRKVFLHIKNANGAQITVSIDTPNAVDGLTVPSKDIAIPNGGERFIGPFIALYEQEDADNSIDQAVKVTFSATTGVTVAVVKLP